MEYYEQLDESVERSASIINRPANASLRQYLKDIRSYPLITADQEKKLGLRIRRGDEQAVNKLVEGNLRFVVFFVKGYRGCGLPYVDLICEGNFGMIQAAKRFDPGKNVKFITYASYWVYMKVIKALGDEIGFCRLPEKKITELGRIRNAQDLLRMKLHREATPEEVAEMINVSAQEVVVLLCVGDRAISLNTVVDKDHDLHLYDQMEDTTIPRPDTHYFEECTERERCKSIMASLKILDPRDQKIIKLRFGLDGKKRKTLRETGEMFGLSRERIRQIEVQVLEKLCKDRRTRGKLRALYRAS